MDFQDYQTPLHKAPPAPPKAPRRIPVGLFMVIGIVVIAALSWLVSEVISENAGESRIARQQSVSAALTIPAAAVLIGEPLAWRELASFCGEADLEHPRPSAVYGDFTGDGQDDILLISLTGATLIIETDGNTTEVARANWETVAVYKTWDYDNNGIDDLIPGPNLYKYRPKAKDYVRIGGGG